MSYFMEYKKSKYTLFKLVCQFYNVSYSSKKCNDLGLEYTDRDKPNDLDSIHFVYHSYTPEGLYIWKVLGLSKPIYSIHEIWDLMDRIKDEKELNKDYERESYELKLLCLSEVKRFYKYEMSVEDAKKGNIEYDEDIDEFEGKIEGCDHIFEGAGESAWNLFGLEKNFEPMSKFYKIENEYENKILKLDLGVK